MDTPNLQSSVNLQNFWCKILSIQNYTYHDNLFRVTRKDSQPEILEAGKKLECIGVMWKYNGLEITYEEKFNALCAERS